MPDTPKNFDDLVRHFGLDNTQMFSEMVRPDQHIERDEDTAPEVTLDPEHERAIIEHIEQSYGRKLTPEERHLALEQARSI